MKRSLERRKDRRALQEKRSLWAFQVILLIFIFFMWLIWAKIYFLFALISSFCVEQAVTFGSSEALSGLYTLLSYTVALMALLWGVIALSFRRAFRHWMSYLVHLTLLVGIGSLFLCFQLLHVPDATAPDGTLGVRAMVKDSEYSPPQFAFPLTIEGRIQKGEWQQRRTSPFANARFYRNPTECVWIDRNIITQNAIFDEIPGYISANNETKMALLENRRFRNNTFPKTSLAKGLVIAVRNVFSEKSLMEALQDSQNYREMTRGERQRFNQKSDCLKESVYPPRTDEECDFVWVWEEF